MRTNSLVKYVMQDMGLVWSRRFYCDYQFIGFVFAGIVVLLFMGLVVPQTFEISESAVWTLLFAVVLWRPVLEELLFRGALQGYLLTFSLGQSRVTGLSAANWLSSLFFVAVHAFFLPASWAIGILAPSLVFGHLRDRFGSVFPSIVMHMLYNLGFVIVNIQYT